MIMGRYVSSYNEGFSTTYFEWVVMSSDAILVDQLSKMCDKCANWMCLWLIFLSQPNLFCLITVEIKELQWLLAQVSISYYDLGYNLYIHSLRIGKLTLHELKPLYTFSLDTNTNYYTSRPNKNTVRLLAWSHTNDLCVNKISQV